MKHFPCPNTQTCSSVHFRHDEQITLFFCLFGFFSFGSVINTQPKGVWFYFQIRIFWYIFSAL